MNHLTDQQLIRDYLAHESEPAFSQLVHRYIDLVYSTALRIAGESHLAKDVTQNVFVSLAQSATQLTGRETIAGWLHLTTRNIAAKMIRSEVRRRNREQEAATMNELLSNASNASWDQIAPQLDIGLSELNENDREALLLRYFQNLDLRSVGTTLGISDDAAQKRVSRAVERLREFFAKRGVTVGASGLAVVISANAVQAAPVGLALTVSAAVLTGTITTATIATPTAMNWITAKSVGTIIAAALAAGTGTYLVQQRESGRLRDENQNLVAEEAKLTGERDAATSEMAAISNQLQGKSNSQELLRLRGEIGTLRRQTQELEKLRQQNRELQQSLAQAAQTSSAAKEAEENPERRAAVAKINDARLLVLGLIMYANDHQDLLPTDMNQASNYWTNADVMLTRTNQFELVIQGSLNQSNLPNPSATIAVREQEPALLNGRWTKAYGFADGHAELKNEPPEGFDAWEKAHMISPAGK